MITELIYGVKNAKVGKFGAMIQLDASIDETHGKSAEVTSHPIESGGNIADHIRALPETIELTGMITNTPIVFLASAFATSPLENSFSHKTDRVSVARDEFERIMDEGEVVDVVTSYKNYSNMAITNLAVNRSAETGNVMSFTLSLQEIAVVQNLLQELAVPEDVMNKAVKNSGNVSSNAAQPAPTEATTGVPASELFSMFFGA